MANANNFYCSSHAKKSKILLSDEAKTNVDQKKYMRIQAAITNKV
jgi:hypothetical protein